MVRGMAIDEKQMERLLVLVRKIQVDTPLPETAAVAMTLGQLFSDQPGMSDMGLVRLVMFGRLHEALRPHVDALLEVQVEGMAAAYRTAMVKRDPMRKR